ncbi:lipocalin-like domain-containing protein [Chryseobacterium oryctis]|uniref:Lipocalin family protein n=1 Tax=Chryseobacterium oryctis TaxID=2952618 RepID=A0ABT3HK39_9FLAO|nr:lipocalin family protein [Chryseobacterium oryctis]MCW3160139.1 lipocalin family protein [Chryseobacterium oryctis]
MTTKFLFSFIVLVLTFSSCSNDGNTQDTIIETPNISGSWKPSRYEFKGKSYAVSDCEKKGQLLVNTDFTGVYERYGIGIDNNCNKFDSFSGKWDYDKMGKILTLTYMENGINKTLTKEIVDFSSIELKILDSSKDLDGIPGNDEATLVFIQQ